MLGEGGGGNSLWGFLVGKIVSHCWILSRAPCEGVLLAILLRKARGTTEKKKKGWSHEAPAAASLSRSEVIPARDMV